MHWYAFQKSKKHGHPDGGGLFKVLTGTLKETRFDPLDTDKVIGTYDYFKGGLAHIHNAEAYHIVENPIPYPAISLHVYMPGISAPNNCAVEANNTANYHAKICLIRDYN